MLSDEDKFLIEQYIDKNLSEADDRILREKINQDSFQREIKRQQLVGSSIKGIYQENLRNELKQLLKEQKVVDEGNKYSGNYKWYAAAAVAAIAVVVSYFFLKTSGNSESVFLAYYTPYPATAITRGSDQSGGFIFQKYADGEYQLAADSLEKKISQTKDLKEVPYLRLVLGNCYLNLNHTDDALSVFKQAMESDDAMLAQHAQWYYALALIRANELAKAREALNKIINSGSVYDMQAAKVLHRIENM